MKKKNLIRKLEENISFTGLVLIGLIACFYSYNNAEKVSIDDLFRIQGELLVQPKVGSQGGEMGLDNILFKLNGDNKLFLIRNCGYDVAKRQIVLSLKKGERVIVFIKIEDKLNNKASVFHLEAPNTSKVPLVDMNLINKCASRYWRNILPFVLVIFVILLFRLFWI